VSRLKEKQQRLEELLAELAEKSAKGIPVVVEGKKDADTLQCLGVCGTIFTVKTGGKSFTQATEDLVADGFLEVILLLDFDRRGKQGTAQLKIALERAQVKVDLRFWHALNVLAGHDIQCIEGLASYMQTLAEKVAKL
jgi:2,5-diamino-6-(ribosylamino)-4(3H)-pyrimidinone 5'-phosphate reductase